ncbi:hypothetical protein A3F55_03060 [Candidatus Adlerbacteria bacterium RIFCSPHIGHO2_12_FULL_53_18]|uniref:NodB homology domain-containing protein n=1 Tax=Candidatus Adlerbacteria bacterium RIFCSPHIGHO2_12_FULL_53_18 TaxID=1797242 RepID=A0A1F4XU32_9BACT|nr:MAG: hypothetical protein A3F55_03060 [Candidatus Adlerbacteria bacterium RIFCSPHIGHO2_12_FULL_53_18]
MKPVIVTTSWDDGHVLDMRLAALLKKYGIKGTFYISPQDREIPAKKRLTDFQIQELARDFDIGAHTMTHPRLPQVSDAEAEQEISNSRTHLQQVTGQPVATFCYPRGEYLPKHVSMVRRAGFSYARTTNRHVFTEQPPLESATTIHCYDHWSDALKVAIFARFNPVTFLRFYRKWDTLALAMFDRVFAEGGTFHLWGHSWEIDKNDDWERLERVLRAIAGRSGVQYDSNSDLVPLS